MQHHVQSVLTGTTSPIATASLVITHARLAMEVQHPAVQVVKVDFSSPTISAGSVQTQIVLPAHFNSSARSVLKATELVMAPV